MREGLHDQEKTKMKVMIDIRYGTCEVEVKGKRKNADGSVTYKGVSAKGVEYQFSNKQVVKEENQ